MTSDTNLEDVKPELATAVGLLALTDAGVPEAAREAGVTRWELEACLEGASLADALGVELDADVTEEIDRVLDEGRS